MVVHGLGILGGWTIATLVFRGLLGLAVITLLVLFIIWAIKGVRHAGKVGMWHQQSDPLEIAKERYSKGEINKEEFEEIKKNLS